MLGIDLYKEVLLNGEKYNGKKYIGSNGKTYSVEARGGNYSILETGKTAGIINMHTHEKGCQGINEFMLTELEEIKPEIEMPWQECLVKYIENPEKYYMKAIGKDDIKYEFDSKTLIGFGVALPMPIIFIKSARWFLCER